MLKQPFPPGSSAVTGRSLPGPILETLENRVVQEEEGLGAAQVLPPPAQTILGTPRWGMLKSPSTTTGVPCKPVSPPKETPIPPGGGEQMEWEAAQNEVSLTVTTRSPPQHRKRSLLQPLSAPEVLHTVLLLTNDI